MARLSVVASPFTILRLPPSRFRPLAPYCPISWHLTAKTPPPAGTLLLPPLCLAPYCYSPAGTLLLTFLAGIPLCSVAPLALLSPSDRSAFPRLRLVVVQHCLRGFVQRLGTM